MRSIVFIVFVLIASYFIFDYDVENNPPASVGFHVSGDYSELIAGHPSQADFSLKYAEVDIVYDSWDVKVIRSDWYHIHVINRNAYYEYGWPNKSLTLDGLFTKPA